MTLADELRDIERNDTVRYWTGGLLARAATELDRLTSERDLAIVHDTQPYPTAWAYEQACAALATAKAELDRLKRLDNLSKGGTFTIPVVVDIGTDGLVDITVEYVGPPRTWPTPPCPYHFAGRDFSDPCPTCGHAIGMHVIAGDRRGECSACKVVGT